MNERSRQLSSEPAAEIVAERECSSKFTED